MTISACPLPDNGDERILPPGKLSGILLDRLITTYRTKPHSSVIVRPGAGRDAAAVSVDVGEHIIVKSDPITFAGDGAAQFLVAVNANDIACLGGVPRWLTVVALFPEGKTTTDSVERMFADLQRACDDRGVAIIGGHTEVTAGLDRPLLIGTMIGTLGPNGLIMPGQAQEGDDLLLTKWIGIEGTALLARELSAHLIATLGEDVTTGAAKLLRNPGISIQKDVDAVLAVDGVTALHDPTEGGLATAIHELADISSCGAEVMADSVPILPETRLICHHLGLDPMGLLSSGALLMAVKSSRRCIVETAATQAGVPITHIGKLVPRSEGVHSVSGGVSLELERFDVDEITRAF